MHSFPWDLDMLPYVLLAHRADLPACAALYVVRTPQAVLYIGITHNLQSRWSTNSRGTGHHRMPDLQAMPDEVCICWMPFGNKETASLPRYERQAIAFYKPSLNRQDVSTGSIVQAARVRAGLSLTECASIAKMRPSVLSRIEHNTRYLYVDDVMKLAGAIGCKPADLIRSLEEDP